MNTAITAPALPTGAHFSAGGPPFEHSALRQAIAHATRLPEAQALAPLLAAARMPAVQAQRTDALARQLVQGLNTLGGGGRQELPTQVGAIRLGHGGLSVEERWSTQGHLAGLSATNPGP